MSEISIASRAVVPKSVVKVDRCFDQTWKCLDLVVVVDESLFDVGFESLIKHGT